MYSKPKCACGRAFANTKELRVHIALLTERWPRQRCDESHYDPSDPQDIKAVNRTLEAPQCT